MTNLPAVGSVWGVPDQPATWVLILTADDTLISGRRFSRFEPAYELKTSQWNPVNGAVDITAIVTGEPCISCGRGLPELTESERARMNSLPADFVKQLWNEEAQRDIPFTVDWLVEIGGRHIQNVDVGAVFFESPAGLQFDYWQQSNRWTINGVNCPNQPRTKRDVLRWLDVLGIVPTGKGAK